MSNRGNYTNYGAMLRDTHKVTGNNMTDTNTDVLSTIKPAKGRVVVLPDPAPEKIGSLIRPDSLAYTPSSGVVTHVGSDVTYKVGDHVLFMKNAGVELTTEPVHFLMREEDIYASI